VLDVVSAALFDPDDDVRESALWAVFFTGWSDFLPLLQRVMREDPREDFEDWAWVLIRSIEGDDMWSPHDYPVTTVVS
jgi:hypothetical protein